MKKLGLATLTVGALMVANAASAAVNLIENGDFDANSPPPGTVPLDWFYAKIGGGVVVGDEIGVVSGPNATNFGALPPTTIQQDFAVVPGQTYTLSFDLAEAGPSVANVFVVKLGFVGGGGSTDLFLLDSSAFGFTPYSFNVTADGTTAELAFSGGNSGGWFALDNVSVVAVPEPATWALMLAGFAGLGAALRSRRSGRAPSALA